MDLEKAYARVNKEALRQVLRIYDVGDTLLNDFTSVSVNSLACFIIKGGESECFRIDSGVKQGCIMSLWFFNVNMNAVMKEVNIKMERKGVRFHEEGRKWRLLGLLYADDLFLCSECRKT